MRAKKNKGLVKRETPGGRHSVSAVLMQAQASQVQVQVELREQMEAMQKEMDGLKSSIAAIASQLGVANDRRGLNA